jgi:hypothetical protein
MVGWRLMVAAAAVAATLGTSRVALASEDYPNEAGWGALAVIANVGYMPAKTIYAIFGGITGGLAYACTGGSFQTASSIWEPSLGGTYILTPSMLRGEQPIAFAGTQSDPAVVSETPAAAGDAPIDDAQSQSGRVEESLPAS